MADKDEDILEEISDEKMNQSNEGKVRVKEIGDEKIDQGSDSKKYWDNPPTEIVEKDLLDASSQQKCQTYHSIMQTCRRFRDIVQTRKTVLLLNFRHTMVK